jgi:mycothiol synthase
VRRRGDNRGPLCSSLVPLERGTVPRVLSALDSLEQQDAVPRIDAEELALLGSYGTTGLIATGWEPLRLDGPTTGASPDVADDTDGGWYVGLHHRADGTLAEVGRTRSDAREVREVLGALEALERSGAPVTVWLRAAQPQDLLAAHAAGWRTRRELHVLARPLSDGPVEVPEGVHLLRGFDATRDVDEVVAVLGRAHGTRHAHAPSSPDGGWSTERFARRTATSLHDPADLRVATDAHGTIVGVHWLKRRGPATGEVHNLAVDPSLHGQGIGRRLLRDGLRHLADLGMHEVLLWVDGTNEPAVALYRAEGFEPRALDVELTGPR